MRPICEPYIIKKDPGAANIKKKKSLSSKNEFGFLT
jgi:hypothetical protein